jgi:hypothetical protein
MSKLTALQAQLEKANSRQTPPAAPVSAAAPSTPAEPRPTSAKAPSREGKTHIGAYLAADFKRSLRLVQAQTGEDTQQLIARALNELFRSHNVPVVDHN